MTTLVRGEIYGAYEYPQKSRSFLWRALANCLPTLSRLSLRNVQVNFLCPICGIMPEWRVIVLSTVFLLEIVGTIFVQRLRALRIMSLGNGLNIFWSITGVRHN